MKKTFVNKMTMLMRNQIAVWLFGTCSFFIAISHHVNSQSNKPAKSDSTKVERLNAISKQYWMKDFDSSVYFAQEALHLAQTLNYKIGIAESYRNLGVTNMYLKDRNTGKQYLQKALTLFASLPDKKGMAATYNNLGVLHTWSGEYLMSLGYLDSALILFRELDDMEGEGSVLNYIGRNYQEQGNYQEAIDYCLQAFEIRKAINDHPGVVYSLLNVGNMYLDVGQLQTALTFYLQGLTYGKEHSLIPPDYLLDQLGKTYLKLKDYDKAETYLVRTINSQPKQINDHLTAGELYAETGRLDSAIQQFNISLKAATGSNNNDMALSLIGLSKVFIKKSDYGSAMSFSKQAYDIAYSSENKLILAEAAAVLAQLFKQGGQHQNALQYFELAHSILDSVTSENYQRKLAFTESKNEIENKQASIILLSAEKDLQEQKLKNEQWLKRFILGVFAIAIILAIVIIRNINAKRKKIQSQKDQIELQRARIENSYEELKTTQAQLIQKEKMASLGELTAGIAHEIQNPLNFVNNFSEVSAEMVDEIKESRNKKREANKNQALQQSSWTTLSEDEKLEDEILEDIKQNLAKINHHGKRADAIVKGMLAHSRTSSGEVVMTDINALADEYLRLSYHGMKAKDKSFSAEYKTEFDPNLPKVNVVPQDIGRVLLNIINNAFYACTTRRSTEGGENITPNVKVSTSYSPLQGGKGGWVEIRISDNGSGIPHSIKDKIFQPFFTTKPTGQGTGLGLSLSYDIVKAHGGEIIVNSQFGEGTDFTIQIPIHEK